MENETNLHIFKGVSDRIWLKTTAHVRGDRGKTIQVPFEIRAKVPTTQQLQEIREKTQTGEMNDSDVAREFVVDWDMPGADGGNVEFNPENFDAALSHPDYLQGITDAMTELVFGRDAARIKNSIRSGKPGRAVQ